MNILVTGGAGYIGSQLICDLALEPGLRGARITVYDNMQDERYQSLMNLPEGGDYDFHYGDIQDLDELTAAAQQADVIIHLAALCNAVVSFDRVEETERVNFCGTDNVVRAALRSPSVRRLIYASTCSVYGETTGTVNEDSPCRPESPYAEYKLAGERLVMGLGEASGGRLTGTALRLATVYGPSPGLRVHTVVNIFVLHGALGMPLTVFGTGDQCRPFVHVRDASAAFVFALLNESTVQQVLNVVGENASVNQILAHVEPRFPKLTIEHKPGRHLNQISYSVDGSRLRAMGWRPAVTLEDGIEEFARLCGSFSTGSFRAVVRG